MIELIILNSLIIFGVYASLQEGFIFEDFGIWLRKLRLGAKRKDYQYPKTFNIWKVKDWIAKPIGTCPVCMASIYGTPVFWFSYLSGYLQYDYIVIVYLGYIVALAGLNYLILGFEPEND